MRFSYDVDKSESNLVKHKIGFEEAQALWNDRDMITTKVWKEGEQREVGLARYGGRCWVVVFKRSGEKIRIISVRKANAKEAASYDKANG